mgnify:CR=1 FL=1
MTTIAFPRWRIESAMAHDAWVAVYRFGNATERSLTIKFIVDLINAGVAPEEARRCGARYAEALAYWTGLAREERGRERHG